MAKYTIKAYPQMQAMNALGKVPVYLRYYYAKKQSAHPLGVSVLPRHWNDAGQGSFRANGENAADNNAMLQRYVECLDAAAAALAEPTWDKVKPAFLALLGEKKAELERKREEAESSENILLGLRVGLDLNLRLHQEKLAALSKTRDKVEQGLRLRFPTALAAVSGSSVNEAEQDAHIFFHDKAKQYVKQFPGKPVSELSRHHIDLPNGKQMRLDMDVPAHAWYKTLLEFEKWSGVRSTFVSIDRDFYESYSSFLWDVKNYEDTSHENHVDRLKMFLNDSVSYGYPVNPFFRHKSFKTYKNSKPIHVLTEQQLDLLRGMDFENKQLNRVRDIFGFQALTGLRYSDLQQPMVIKNDRIVGVTQKTSGNYSIPLVLYPDARLLVLGERYAWHFKIDDNTYRRSIKDLMKVLFARLGLGEPKGKPETDVYFFQRGTARLDQLTGKLPRMPLADAFSSHNARKTFCTVMFLKGYSVEMVAKIIGSKRQDVLRNNYISFIDSDLDKMIKRNEAQQELQAKLARQEAELAALRRELAGR